MVVVLIIAILIAIAIPTFLGARQKAQDRAAQSSLRIGLTAIRTAYIDGQSYLTASAELASIEPSSSFSTTPAGTPRATSRFPGGSACSFSQPTPPSFSPQGISGRS